MTSDCLTRIYDMVYRELTTWTIIKGNRLDIDMEPRIHGLLCQILEEIQNERYKCLSDAQNVSTQEEVCNRRIRKTKVTTIC